MATCLSPAMRRKLLEGRSLWKWALFALTTVVVLALVSFLSDADFAKTLLFRGNNNHPHGGGVVLHTQVASGSTGDHILNLPEILLRKGIYSNDSFVNEAGVVPAYWQGEKIHHSLVVRQPSTNYGPCYSYDSDHPVDWEAEIAKFNSTGEPEYNTGRIMRGQPSAKDLQGYCRPGFIIIGAGKCGTSSLYHYISSHPRVLPASQKQIHYFKYHNREPMKWYYQYFPKTSSFLAAGALMSGEASPGYLPYPDVVLDMKKRLATPRILVIGRNPIERAYSSYKYNYVVPEMKYLTSGKHNGISRGETEDYYKQFLFSFDDMMRAELAVLRECFAPGSEAELQTRKVWGKVPWVKKELERRKAAGLPPLIDLDGFCYGSYVNSTVLRRQWTDLVATYPDKLILDRNLHLKQAFIGRSLYLFPLEWWYAAFPKEHIYFVCTEELEDFSGEAMNSIGQFLGLPRYDNFSEVVQGGAFNVGGHRGYDNEISWEKIEDDHKKDEIPLSSELRKEIEDFIRPYNQRLFDMSGRQCDW